MACKACGGKKWKKLHTQWCNFKGQQIIAKLFECQKCAQVYIALDSAESVMQATKLWREKQGNTKMPSPKRTKVVEKLTSEELAVRKKMPKLNIKKNFKTIKKTGGIGNYGY